MIGLYGLLLVLLLLGFQEALVTDEKYLLSLGRQDQSNEITLMCQNRQTHVNIPGTKFWRYSTDVGSDLEQICQSQSSNCTFTITPAFEGYFICGLEGPNSNNKTLVAYPSRNPDTKTFYIVKAGDTVELDCGVGPGALSQYYTVEWMNVLAFSPVNNPRYCIHASNFSLTIHDTELSDGGRYSCYVAVDDPNSQNSPDDTEETLISLVVYEPPSLSTGPFEVLVVVDGDQKSMTFTCTSGASTSDFTLFWKQNGKKIRNETRHAIIESTDGGHIESNLTVSDIRADDCGLIKCEILITADADPGNEDSGDQTSTFSVGTSFTVLSDEFYLQVDTITGGQLQFCFTDLSPNIPEPVKFRIRFTSVTEGQTKYLLTHSEYPITMDNMCFPIAISDVPFEERLIRVQTAMVVRGITGPYVPDMDSAPEIDLSNPGSTTDGQSTDGTPAAESTGAIIGYSIGGGVLVIVIVVIVIMTIRITTRRKHNQEMRDIINNPDKPSWERKAAAANLRPDGSEPVNGHGTVLEGAAPEGDVNGTVLVAAAPEGYVEEGQKSESTQL